MRDHRRLFVVPLVSALSLQSSVGEGRDGALRWTGLTRAELYSGRDAERVNDFETTRVRNLVTRTFGDSADGRGD